MPITITSLTPPPAPALAPAPAPTEVIEQPQQTEADVAKKNQPAPATVSTLVVPDSFVQELPALAKDLFQYTIVIHQPTWSVRPPSDTELMAVKADNNGDATDENGRTVKVKRVTGKHSSGTLQYDVHDIFVKIAANRRAIEKLMDVYSFRDVDDGFRLVSAFKKEEFEAALYVLENDRQQLAAEVDRLFSNGELEECIRKEHPDYAAYIIGRMPQPPFGPRLNITVRRRAVPKFDEDFDLSKVSPETRNIVAVRIKAQAEAYAREQAKALVSGLMDPVVDLAVELQGKKPNPDFDPQKPVGPKNARFMPGIDSGSKRGGFLDRLLTTLDRLNNFSQLMPSEVVQQVKKAKDAVARANGNVETINADSAIQKAITMEFANLAQELEKSMAGKGRRAIAV